MNGGIAPSQGPRYGISSVTATQAPKRTAYLSAPGTQPSVPSSQMPRPALVPMISESRNWPAHVARERALDPREQRQEPGWGGNRRSTARASLGMSSSM